MLALAYKEFLGNSPLWFKNIILLFLVVCFKTLIASRLLLIRLLNTVSICTVQPCMMASFSGNSVLIFVIFSRSDWLCSKIFMALL